MVEVKSGQSRNVNKMGATNKTLAFIDRKRYHGVKPVSINFLRQIVKNLNKTIDSNPQDAHLQMRLIRQRQTVYTAIQMFQHSYSIGDMSAVATRNWCRRNGVVLPSDATPTIRYGGGSAEMVGKTLGIGNFDAMGAHQLVREGRAIISHNLKNDGGAHAYRSAQRPVKSIADYDRETGKLIPVSHAKQKKDAVKR